MDLAEYRTLFVLSFTTPAFDPEVAPSFGTLLATINVALSMLGEVDESGKIVHSDVVGSPVCRSFIVLWGFFFFQIEKKKEPAALSLATLTSSEEIQALK